MDISNISIVLFFISMGQELFSFHLNEALDYFFLIYLNCQHHSSDSSAHAIRVK